MKARAAITAMVLALAATGVADESAGWHGIVELFRDRDLIAIQHINTGAIEALPLEQRNAIALAAARSLAIADYLYAVGDPPVPQCFTSPPADDNPAKAECRRQWGINSSAAELLRHLAERRLIDDPRLLPYLIEGLDHPDRSSVGQKCFYALSYLTRHRSGDAYWARMVADERKHREIVRWWQDWWDRCSDKHPVFNAEAESLSRAEVLGAARRIEEQVKPHHPELSLFSVPDELTPQLSSRFFQIEYNPWCYSLVPPAMVDRGNLPWLCISSRFQSQDLSSDVTWPESAPTPPPALARRMVMIHSMVLPGTDIVVEVVAASEDEGLMSDLRTELAGIQSAEPGGPDRLLSGQDSEVPPR